MVVTKESQALSRCPAITTSSRPLLSVHCPHRVSRCIVSPPTTFLTYRRLVHPKHSHRSDSLVRFVWSDGRTLPLFELYLRSARRELEKPILAWFSQAIPSNLNLSKPHLRCNGLRITKPSPGGPSHRGSPSFRSSHSYRFGFPARCLYSLCPSLQVRGSQGN